MQSEPLHFFMRQKPPYIATTVFHIGGLGNKICGTKFKTINGRN